MCIRDSYYPGRREVVLDQGEGFFEVAPDSGRPFTVDARQSRVTVVGTAFDVRTTPEDVYKRQSRWRPSRWWTRRRAAASPA